MKHVLRTWLILLLTTGTTEAQTNVDSNNSSRGRRFHVKVTLTDGQKFKGVLRLISDNRIQLLNRKAVGKKRPGANEVPDTLHYTYIEKIKIRSTAASIGGFFGGIVVGSAVGGVIGFFAPDDDKYDYSDDFRKLTAFLGIGAGGVIGGVAGTQLAPRGFEVAGQYYSFQKFREKMIKKGMKVTD